ncbi:MAG: tRNA uridine-5-carboxymethylaminomethyl(34) synthesis GTPase MnmE [Bacteroidales bacterium]|nr:tRNA uridine-5-carboxymethylaminomethyl(34) synthesis GTPase MnmE [Bacteroidales bacterium]
MSKNDTICAVSTASGVGAIAVIRLSGAESHKIALFIFRKKGKQLDINDIEPNKAYYGEIFDPIKDDKPMVDDVLITFFKAPHSYTGEDSVEISCHGSVFIQQKILELLVVRGCRLAKPGEFSKRAFINDKFDLAQAEAVADLIASQNEAEHRIAVNQLKGGFSNELRDLRSKLVDLTSLLELELDFSEEDVEFADRTKLYELLNTALKHIGKLTDSFRMGNAIKNGIPVAIVGETNTGKSTLLNAILGEERAIVSDIEGTTRDTIEETFNIDGLMYRFIDTAGIRETSETIEKIGIERTFKKISEADIVIGMLDGTKSVKKIIEAWKTIVSHVNVLKQKLLIIVNKQDIMDVATMFTLNDDYIDYMKPTFEKNIENYGGYMTDEYCYSITGMDLYDIRELMTFSYISAKNQEDVDGLKQNIHHCTTLPNIDGSTTLVANIRHFEALTHAKESLEQVKKGMDDKLSADLLAQDLRQALYYIGSITGEVTNSEVLGNIFGRFCIGK